MFDWISHNKELFLKSHTEIGVSYQHAVELQTQHNHFAMNSMVRHSMVILFAWRKSLLKVLGFVCVGDFK